MIDKFSNDHLELYARFDYGNNPAFDELVRAYFSEASEDHASGKSATPLSEYVMAWVSESNKAYTHADFVAAIQRDKASVRWLGEPYTIVSAGGGVIFGILCVLYQSAPFLLFPICAFAMRDWWLLLGAVLSAKASGIAARYYSFHSGVHWNKLIAGLLMLMLLTDAALLYVSGFHGYLFWPFAFLWGFTFYIWAELAQITFATRSLVESPELFHQAILENKILIEGR